MFEALSQKLNQIFDQLKRRGKLSEADVDEAMRAIRLALLDADVHYGVVKDLVSRLRARAVGAEVSNALSPGQQVIKIVHDELIATLGSPAPLNLTGPKPHMIMLVGLQGSGKTTMAAKLAYHLRNRGERTLLVAGDPYRPAAAEQLTILGQQMDTPVLVEPGMSPPDLAVRAFEKAGMGGYSVVIMDTAGRSQIDEVMMTELKAICERSQPVEILLVVDAMIGQEALHVADGFLKAIPITGLVMSKMDGDARGGAAISIRSISGIPIKYLGTGEKTDALEVFQPDRLASRILGMGDVIGLIEKAEAAYDEKTARQSAQKLANGEFDLEDLLEMMRSSKKMGPMSQLAEMLPGDMGKAARGVSPAEMDRSMKRTEAIIQSMTIQERRYPDILNASRRRRIAGGAGLQVQDVNRLVKQFREIKNIMRTLKKTGVRGLGKIFG